MAAELALDLPVIFRGFLALIAEIMRHLPDSQRDEPRTHAGLCALAGCHRR